MCFLRLLCVVGAVVLASFVTSVSASGNGLTDVVTWDEGSLIVRGERVFVFSGEFHYPRLPVPELWLDVFQKFKANGLNAVSIYFFWSYHSPAPDVFDFESPAKDVQRLLDMAKQAGLYVIARPGPYVNAETNAGGIALWGTDGIGAGTKLRTSDEAYHQAWLPWIQAIGKIIAKNQMTEEGGGPVIMVQVENELTESRHEANDTLVLYMEQIKTALRDAGVIVPFSSNEKGMRGQSWSTDYQNVGGSVDIYGLDSYPGGMSCSNPDSGFNVVRTYYQWFQNYSFTQPESLPEFEAGWFQPWGGAFYDDCQAEHSPEFADVYYKDVLAQRATLLNLYVAFGGTNWGHLAAPVVYSSYDYAAPLRETREVTPKFSQTKLVALFARASRALRHTVMESNGTGNAVDSQDIWTWVLRNQDSAARFYFAEHNSTKSRANTTFTLTARTSRGDVAIDSLDLRGRQARVVVTDYAVGNATLLFSSAQVLTWGLFDGDGSAPVLVFYLDVGQTGEFAFASNAGGYSNFTVHGATSDFGLARNGSAFRYTQGEGATVVKFGSGALAYLLDTATAYTFFAPATTDDPDVGADEQVFALGPYLVRSASVADGVVDLHGDTANSTTLEVYAGKTAKQLRWNGVELSTMRTPYGALKADVRGAEDISIELPSLADQAWLVADGLPEAARTYDDSGWTLANKTSSNLPEAPLTLPVLHGSAYGFYAGTLVYRGYFDGRAASGANITVQGGTAAGWSAWANGAFVGGHAGNASLSATSAVLRFEGAALVDEANVLTVVTDYSGHDETSQGPYGPLNARGIVGARLLASTNSSNNSTTTTTTTTVSGFSHWKLAGAAGGPAYIDPVRGPLNEGGHHFERLGWHLPGYNASGAAAGTRWEAGSPLTGFTGAGIRFYRTEFLVTVPEGVDAPLGIEIVAAADAPPLRVQLYVNGYQVGKYWAAVGPQTVFPVPVGVLDQSGGGNVLGVGVWAQDEGEARLQTLRLVRYNAYRSGFEGGFGERAAWEGLRPGWGREREAFA
ncbi:glycoside hydrolase family 35 protein [Aplosporella prunicola CBS 121167]|uniref:beta-galactosidase n=1 Tax=Aplosporella prunicola CBS 121167 TaxID=1176127 RepID=A0A6A6B1S8_9PEZI|nr:glycoside hydrolase family 35 protein [Aplosporella prunicola CBS 121167]KAF2138162.1 glycoside hydrolase family 35 protein [Aplosporella prunicola CBS 121167]